MSSEWLVIKDALSQLSGMRSLRIQEAAAAIVLSERLLSTYSRIYDDLYMAEQRDGNVGYRSKHFLKTRKKGAVRP